MIGGKKENLTAGLIQTILVLVLIPKLLFIYLLTHFNSYKTSKSVSIRKAYFAKLRIRK